MSGNTNEESTGGGSREFEYADVDEPQCKYCGGPVEKIIPEGAPYWNCERHGKLDVSEVLGITPGEIPEWERVSNEG